MELLCIFLTIAFIIVGSNEQELKQPPEEYFLNDVTISLERTACFGTCPDYSLMIRGDGSVIYEGRQFVKIKGQEKKQISTDDVVKLLRKFYEIDFFSFNAEYKEERDISVKPDGRIQEVTMMVTDQPTTHVHLRIDYYQKSVEDYYNAPDSLRQLEKMIDDVSGATNWVGNSTLFEWLGNSTIFE